MATGQRPRRAETRTPKRMLVELSSFENVVYEVTYTVNVSRRGARILSKEVWKPNQRLSVRSVEGKLNARGRIAYCDSMGPGCYAIGLELDHPHTNGGHPRKRLPSIIVAACERRFWGCRKRPYTQKKTPS